MTESARSRTEVDQPTVAGATVTEHDDTCSWCGDPAVVFTNRLGAHCAEHYAEGVENQQLHEAGL